MDNVGTQCFSVAAEPSLAELQGRHRSVVAENSHTAVAEHGRNNDMVWLGQSLCWLSVIATTGITVLVWLAFY